MLTIAIPGILGRVKYDRRYSAILNRATALGYTWPSAIIRSYQNQLLIELVNAGIWDLRDYITVFANGGGGGGGFSLINWKNPSGALGAVVNAPTLENHGWKFNGTNQYCQSGFTVSTDAVLLTVSTGSFDLYLENLALSSSKYHGCRTASNDNELILAPAYSANVVDARCVTDGGTGIGSNAQFDIANGFYQTIREAGNIYCRKNTGARVVGGTPTSGALPANQFTIGALRTGTSTIGQYTDHRCGYFAIGASLGATLEGTNNTIISNYISKF